MLSAEQPPSSCCIPWNSPALLPENKDHWTSTEQNVGFQILVKIMQYVGWVDGWVMGWTSEHTSAKSTYGANNANTGEGGALWRKLSLQLPVELPINPSFRRIANTVLRSNLACLFSQTTIGGETNFLTLEFFGFIENLFQLAFKYSCVFFTSSVLVRVS